MVWHVLSLMATLEVKIVPNLTNKHLVKDKSKNRKYNIQTAKITENYQLTELCLSVISNNENTVLKFI